MTESFTETLDMDTLKLLLKEKGKELKAFESKNKKLEERYLKIFKDNKNLTKDREILEKLLQVIFDQDSEKFINIELGTYDYNALMEIWSQRQEEKINLFNETLESHKKDKYNLEQTLRTYEEQLVKSKEQLEKALLHYNPETEKIAVAYKQCIMDLEKVNQGLQQEIKDLNETIEERSRRLKSVEDEVDSVKAELLMKELEMKNLNEDLNIKTKMQENERKNEVLRLRQAMEDTQAVVKQLERENEELKAMGVRSVKEEGVQTECSMEGVSSMCFQDHQEASPNQNTSTTGSFSKLESESSGCNENGHVNQEYLKNVILKLFCYVEGNNWKEARILMNAICIILKMSAEDKEKIEEARRNNTLWSTTLSFLKDTFTVKGDVNYYTSSVERK